MDDIRFDELFSGDLENLVELPKRVVRLFISSTFTDMTLERNTLMERVYPRLKKYCRERHGLDFQVVDMRWGVRDEATDDHQTASLCSREIDNCQRMSLGPNFVALVGDKYGFRPLSNKIKSSEYRSLRQALIQLDINTDFLDVWYKEDTNAMPAEYLLQPISSILKNFTNKSEPDLQSIDQRIWSAIQDRLHELLLSGSRELVKQGRMSLEDQLMKYSISVTEREIIEGCLDVKEPKLHCLVFIRKIVDLRHHMDDCLAKLSPIWSQQLNASSGGGGSGEAGGRRGSRGRKDSATRRASLKIGDDVISLNTSCAMNASERRLERQRKLIGRYIDMRSTKDNMWQLDEEAQEALASLRDVKLINKLERPDAKMQNLTKFRITWDENEGVSGKYEEHKVYLNELSELFYANLTRMIRRASRNEEHTFVKSSSLVNEMLQHSHYAKHVASSFHGRSRELDKMRAYVMGDANLSSKPMFLYGVGGSGKTSLMAKAATMAKDWILRSKLQQQSNPDATKMLDRTTTSSNIIKWNYRPCIIMRFCCTTPSSSSMLDVLSSVARQLQYHFYQYGPLSGQSQQHEQHLSTRRNKQGNNESITSSADDSFGTQLAYQQLPEDFVQLVFSFRQLLDNCRHSLHSKRLFIIILDSIERLTTPAQSGVEVKYSWLTSIVRLPPNVRLIVSCSSEQSNGGHDYASFVHLKRHFLQAHFLQMRQLLRHETIQSYHEDNSIDLEDSQGFKDKRLRLKSLASLKTSRLPWIIHVKPLGVHLATEVVRHWLKDKGRNLSAQQWSMVERCFAHCSRPIFVKLAFGEVLNWRSYSMQSDAKGLTFGSALIGNNKNQLLASYSLTDPILASLAAHCGSDFDDFCESDQMKLQILTMEQEWLNYYEHKQRKEQIVQQQSSIENSQQPELINKTNNTNKDLAATGSVLIKIDTMLGSGGGGGGAKWAGSPANSVSASLCHLSNTIDDAISQLFARIELQHGFILTKHSLSYLTIARNGICENELEDVLSLDDVVLDDVFQYHLPPVRRIPPLLWTRIRNDLPDYLSERDADGIVINWHHGQFKRVTQARYLADKQQLIYFHSILADYFLGRWADKAKPFRCTRQQIQMAAEQLDSALQQSARDSQQAAGRSSGAEQEGGSVSGGTPSAGRRNSGSRAAASKTVGSRSIQRPRASVTGSIGRLTGQRSGSIRSGSSFAVRNRLRGSEMNDSRLQSMQAKADRRVPHQPLFYMIDNTSTTNNIQYQSSISTQADNHKMVDGSSGNGGDSVQQSSLGTTQRRYNMRKLTELPYHLVRAGRYLDLAQGVLFNYDWLSAALDALGLQSLLADFEDAIGGLEKSLAHLERLKLDTNSSTADTNLVISSTANEYAITRSMMINYGLMSDQLAELADQSLDAELIGQMISQLRKLESTIRLSCSVLHTDPKMLAPQLIGRLISLVQPAPVLARVEASSSYSTTITSNGGQFNSTANNNKWLAMLLEQCDKHGCSECSLLPTDQCLQSPDGMQSSSLEGHPFGVTSMAMGADHRHLLAVSNRFIMWDTSTGQISREVNPKLEASIMLQVEIGYNSEFAIAYTSNNLILALDILTQQVVSFELPRSPSDHQLIEDNHNICGLSLIDRYGASRFVVWTRSSWFVLRIVNNELDQSVTMRQRISLELAYQLTLNCIPGASYLWSRIVSVRCSKQQHTTTKRHSIKDASQTREELIEREYSFLGVESIDPGSRLELITLSCPTIGHQKNTPGRHLEIWDHYDSESSSQDYNAASLFAIDRHCKQLVFANCKGDILLSRRRASSWSKPKLLMSNDDLAISNQEGDDGDLVPLCIELDSPNPSKRELESLLLLDDDLDRDELAHFEHRVEDLDEELGSEVDSQPVFKLHEQVAETSTPSTGVQLIKLYYGSKIIVLQLTKDYEKKYVLNFPKEIQNVSIELGQCQVSALCLGESVEFLVASAGKRLLFFSLIKQTLLRSIEAHSGRIVQLLPVSNQNGRLSVASASMDKTVKIWTLSNVDKPDELIQRLSDRIEQLSVLNNGQVPVAACLTRTGQLGLFNWATLKLVHPRLGHAGDPESNARLDLGSGVLNRQSSRIFRAQFSPNGQFLCLATQAHIQLYTFESFQAKPLGAGSSNLNQLTLKLHSKLCLTNNSSGAGVRVLKLKFVLQDSRILTILEQTSLDTSTSIEQQQSVSSTPESGIVYNSSTSQWRRLDKTKPETRRLVVLCHSLSDSRLVYSIELNQNQSQAVVLSSVAPSAKAQPKSQPAKQEQADSRGQKSEQTSQVVVAPGNKLTSATTKVNKHASCPLPVVTKDRLHLVSLEWSLHEPTSFELPTDSSCSGGRFLKVYSTRDGLLMRAISLDRLETSITSNLASTSDDHQSSFAVSKDHAHSQTSPKSTNNQARFQVNPCNSLAANSIPLGSSSGSTTQAAAAAAAAAIQQLDRQTVSLMNEPVTKLRALVHRDRATVVALIDEESGTSHLLDVNSRQLLISSSLWSGKLSSDARFGLTRFFRSASNSRNSLRLTNNQISSNQKRLNPNHARNSSTTTSLATLLQPTTNDLQANQQQQTTHTATPGGNLMGSSGLELLEMRRMTCLHTLLSGHDLARLGASRSSSAASNGEIVVSRASGLSDQELQCGFTRPNDQYVYYYDPRLTNLLLIRVRDSKLMANYRLAAPLTQIKCSPDGLALILAHCDGSICTLAIADPEKNDTLVRLAQYPSRRQTAIGR